MLAVTFFMVTAMDFVNNRYLLQDNEQDIATAWNNPDQLGLGQGAENSSLDAEFGQ